MKEVTFIRRNIEKWKQAEKIVEQADSLSPDELADAYTELTADLAFAQTHFPASRITIYLNNLASALHNRIYRNKREKWSRIITYWTREVPSAMHDARRELVASFIIFVVSALIGVVSAAGDPDFVRLILGNSYVDMTLNNIANGESMAVYNGSSEFPMFLSITLNNIMVSFNCFAMGLLTSFGTGYMLLNNGIMIGAFQTFFYQHDLLWESSLAIWLHGTLEIWAIIVAGAGRSCPGQRMALSRNLFKAGIFQTGSQKRTENSGGYGTRIHHGRIYRRIRYPPYRTSGCFEVRLYSTLFVVYLFFIIFIYLTERSMEAQKPKIALYVQRSFGEKLTATFDFIKENWKPLMKFTTYLMLPLLPASGAEPERADERYNGFG